MLALEITQFDRQIQALAAVHSLRTWLSVRVGLCGAGEPWLDLTRRRAAIAVHQVAVVAPLTRFEVAVAAGWGAGVGRPRPIRSSADRLLSAGLRAAGAVAVEQAVRPRASRRQLRRIGAAIATSPASRMPLPHTVLAQTLGDPVQLQPGSIWQVDEQPSPLWMFLSSHCSPGSSTPLPQSLELSRSPASAPPTTVTPSLPVPSEVSGWAYWGPSGNGVTRSFAPPSTLPASAVPATASTSAAVAAAASLLATPPVAVGPSLPVAPPVPGSARS